MNYLNVDYYQAASSLIPQAEGIIKDALQKEGLLKQISGFPEWTKEHPNDKYHGQKCTNLVKALQGAKDAGKHSKLDKFMSLGKINIEDIRNARNGLLHGETTNVSEHEVSNIVYLLHALYHVLELNISFGK